MRYGECLNSHKPCTLHYLTSIVDPLGRAGVRNEYDDDGRLVAHVDAKGNRIEFDHDLVGRIEEVTDRSGAVTTGRGV